MRYRIADQSGRIQEHPVFHDHDEAKWYAQRTGQQVVPESLDDSFRDPPDMQPMGVCEYSGDANARV